MDRDEALRLLTGGPEGVAEWNRRREAGEGIPDLSEVNLTRANLAGANLDDASLYRAMLVGATLVEARLGGITVYQPPAPGRRGVGGPRPPRTLD